MGRGWGKNGGRGTGEKKHKWWVQNREQKVKNSIGNGEVKVFMCTTDGYELRRGMMEGRRVQVGRR